MPTSIVVGRNESSGQNKRSSTSRRPARINYPKRQFPKGRLTKSSKELRKCIKYKVRTESYKEILRSAVRNKAGKWYLPGD